jgi:hypothetical protein
MADNSNESVIDFRIRRLTIFAPAALEQPFIQNGIIDQAVSLDANGKSHLNPAETHPQCGELGDGGFNWLIRVDKNAGTITTGGSPPSSDPFNVGYCFANGTTVAPVVASATIVNDAFDAAAIARLNMPIFVHGQSSDMVVLPLRQATFRTVRFSADGNCIGSYNVYALDDTCHDVRDDCEKWYTDGALGAYVTLEDADRVDVQDLSASLCVLLTQSRGVDPIPPSTIRRCMRDGSGNIAFKGDYCSTSNSAGGCQDSYWLSATFAASAVKIHDGTKDPAAAALCNGGSAGDAGASDASGD